MSTLGVASSATGSVSVVGGQLVWPTSVGLGRARRDPRSVSRWWRRRHRWDPNGWQRLIVGPLFALDRAATSTTAAGATSAGRTATGSNPPDGTARSFQELLEADPAFQLQALVEDHSEAVYRVALSVVRDPALAEDVAQESFLKAWTALPTFRGESPLRNWILRITHNTAVSLLRTRREELRGPSELPEPDPAGGATSVERGVENQLAVAAFEDALGSLDELSRSIVVLRELENMSYDEIGEVLDLPLPTVKTRLLRARRVLATTLEGWKP
ncbi:MAG: RNA polymerase sigma factor [Acidimicrobiales bacterium]|nr:RNA polymerase sigma factor [Acidimicrobiales bacterium]